MEDFVDIQYVLNGIVFVWNKQKAQSNQQKQDGVTFEQAAEVFFDPFVKIVDASQELEAREAAIGLDCKWNLLFVVHVIREDERIRIISARRATRQERKDYEI